MKSFGTPLAALASESSGWIFLGNLASQLRYNTNSAILALFYDSHAIILLLLFFSNSSRVLSLSLTFIHHHADGLSLPVIPCVSFPFHLLVAFCKFVLLDGLQDREFIKGLQFFRNT